MRENFCCVFLYRLNHQICTYLQCGVRNFDLIHQNINMYMQQMHNLFHIVFQHQRVLFLLPDLFEMGWIFQYGYHNINVWWCSFSCWQKSEAANHLYKIQYHLKNSHIVLRSHTGYSSDHVQRESSSWGTLIWMSNYGRVSAVGFLHLHLDYC